MVEPLEVDALQTSDLHVAPSHRTIAMFAAEARIDVPVTVVQELVNILLIELVNIDPALDSWFLLFITSLSSMLLLINLVHVSCES